MPSNTAPKTIQLRGLAPRIGGKAGAAGVLPGHLLSRASGGTFVVHPTAAGMAEVLIADVEEYVGGSIDTAFANSDHIPILQGQKGDQFYMLLKTGNNVVIGDFLESAGDGTLQKSTHAVTSATTAAAWPLFVALEAVNNASGSAQRIKVETL